MTDKIQIQEKVKQFIINTAYISEDQINDQTLVFTEGIMDSMAFISLLSFIEETFSITASDNELLETNFESIDAISAFVIKKLNIH